MLLSSQPMRDNNTSALREMFQYCDPHLDQTKLNDLLPLTIDGVLAVIDLNTLFEIVFNSFFGAPSALVVRTKRYITIRSLQCIPLLAPNPI